MPLLVCPPPDDLHSLQPLTWFSRAFFSMRPARVFSVGLSHRGAPWHPESAFASFCCILSLDIDAEQFCGHSGVEAGGIIEAPERKEDRMLELR